MAFSSFNTVSVLCDTVHFMSSFRCCTAWANNTGFPIDKPSNLIPGFDPIIGQDTDPTARTLSGTDPNNQTNQLKLSTQWVVPRGGEYFFSPSIPALKSTFAVSS